MARGSIARLNTWDTAVAQLQASGCRYRLRLVQASPFIYVRDWKAPPGSKQQWSLAPLRRDVDADVRTAYELIVHAGNGPWLEGVTSLEEAISWKRIAEICQEDWAGRMKNSSAAHYLAALRDLARQEVARTSAGCRGWVAQKAPGARPFLTRIETLGQIRRSLTRGHEPPAWIPDDLLSELRRLHAAHRPKRVNDLKGIRGIPTRPEAEAYLDGLGAAFPLEQWCLATQCCYGLRNHELWWCSEITVAAEDVQPGWILVPGWWRTKSREEHWVWPIYPEWIERYGLAERLLWAQGELHQRKRPALVSAQDQSRPWVPGSPADPGLCLNNHYLGSWITHRLRTVLPPWLARVPDTGGRYRLSDRPAVITPYDLRHTWAVTVATDPRWSHVRDEDAARAMGHDLEVHRRRYQRWIGAEERRRRAMSAVRVLMM